MEIVVARREKMLGCSAAFVCCARGMVEERKERSIGRGWWWSVFSFLSSSGYFDACLVKVCYIFLPLQLKFPANVLRPAIQVYYFSFSITPTIQINMWPLGVKTRFGTSTIDLLIKGDTPCFCVPGLEILRLYPVVAKILSFSGAESRLSCLLGAVLFMQRISPVFWKLLVHGFSCKFYLEITKPLESNFKHT